MALIKAFRADKRRFAVGQAIVTASEFPQRNPSGKQLEQVFTAAKPEGKPERIGSLFVFENYDDAEWHWAKMADGVLYECEIGGTAILHRGDMKLIDIAGQQLTAGSDPMPHANRYWAGEGTGKPCWELLVAGASITKIICDDQKLRRARMAKGQRLPRP